jgi:hypothetical protein
MVMTSDVPADTTMMRIVHDALRRDLTRAEAALTEPTRTNRHQRRTIGAHLTWMMHFLHAHHASEDDGLYPLVRERARNDAEALGALDRMCHEHGEIATAVATVEATAAALAADGSDDGRDAPLLRSVLSRLCSCPTYRRRRTRPCP